MPMQGSDDNHERDYWVIGCTKYLRKPLISLPTTSPAISWNAEPALVYGGECE